MARFVASRFALLLLVMATAASLGCAEDTSNEGEYSGVVANVVEDPPPEGDVPPPYVPEEPSISVVEEESLLLPEKVPGGIEGVGTHFVVTDSAYLNVTLASDQPIQLSLESVPRTITMRLVASQEATSTQIILTGLEPTTTYYKYTDNYHNLEELVTDATGTCAYTQDLREPHLVFIQPTASTIYLTETGWVLPPGEPPVGDWDPTTLTGTLIRDVSETIQIDGDGITLDGAGIYTVSGTGAGYGVYPNADHTTVKNVTVDGFTYGIIMGRANQTATGNTVQNNYAGIFIGGNNATVTANTARNNSSHGMIVYGSGNDISGNVISNNGRYGVWIYGRSAAKPSDNTLSDNTLSNNVRSGIAVEASPDNVFSGNYMHADQRWQAAGFYVIDSLRGSFTGNTVSNEYSISAGIFVAGDSHGTIISANDTTNTSISLLGYEDYYGYTPIANCTVEDNIVRRGILQLRTADACIVSNNTLENSTIQLIRASNTLVEDNTQWDTVADWLGAGIHITGSANRYSAENRLIRNTASDNSDAGILIQGFANNTWLAENNTSRNGQYGIVILPEFGLSDDNNTVTGNVASANGNSGIYVAGDNCTISGNVVSDNGDSGLRLGTTNTTVVNTTALNNQVGILLQGARYTEVSDSTVSGNRIGIYLYSFAQHNWVRDNWVSDNQYGIVFYGQADENSVHNNAVCLSSSVSLTLSSYSEDNIIYSNDFTTNARQVSAYFQGRNYLNTEPSSGGGNYWSHLGPPSYVDEDPQDGFYDRAYIAWQDIYVGEAIDYYPLVVSPLTESCDNEGPITSDVTVIPSVAQVGGGVELTAIVDDTDTGGSNIAFAEYSIEGGEWVPMLPLDGAFDNPTENVESYITASATAGVYEVCVRGTDALDNVGEPECTFLVAYDPDGGFVTGGGWIDSPEGAYAPDPTLSGKANFGFVSKYKKGAIAPTGNTEFQFKVADLNFKSTSYDWLVIAGDNARYKGEGTINGEGSYKFMLWGGDGTGTDGADTFRIRIWTEDEVTAVETDVYDNGFGQDLGGGSVVIHKAK